MSKSNLFYIGFFVFSLSMQYLQAQTQNSEVPVCDISSQGASDIETTIALIELQEALIKTNRDLQNTNNKALILLLQRKQLALLEQINKIERLDQDKIKFYLSQTRDHQDTKLFWIITGIAATATITTLAMSSYDPDNGWSLPSTNVFSKNIQRIRSVTNKFFTISPQNHLPQDQPPPNNNNNHQDENQNPPLPDQNLPIPPQEPPIVPQEQIIPPPQPNNNNQEQRAHRRRRNGLVLRRKKSDRQQEINTEEQTQQGWWSSVTEGFSNLKKKWLG